MTSVPSAYFDFAHLALLADVYFIIFFFVSIFMHKHLVSLAAQFLSHRYRYVGKGVHVRSSHEHPQVTFFWTQLEAIVATDAKLGCEFRYRVCGNLI